MIGIQVSASEAMDDCDKKSVIQRTISLRTFPSGESARAIEVSAVGGSDEASVQAGLWTSSFLVCVSSE